MIALLYSVAAEAELLTAAMTSARTRTIGSKAIMEGMLAGRPVLLCAGGMGKVNAAHASTLLLASGTVEALIIFGIGGAYPASGAKTGDLAIAKEEIAGDEGVLTAEGFKDTAYIGIPLVKTSSTRLFNAYPAPEPLVKKSLESIERLPDRRIHAGSFVTLSSCTGTSIRSRELEQRYHGLCENMEGAAAAQVALYHGVPWVEVRGISNLVEDRDLSRWNITGAAEAAQKAVLDILKGWDR